MMTRANYDHKHSAHQVTQAHIDEADGTLNKLSCGLTQAFKLMDALHEADPTCDPDYAMSLHSSKRHLREQSDKLHTAINLTEESLEEIYAALSGLARLLDEAGYEVNVPAANIAALITPHIRTISTVREMLQGAAR